MLGFAPLNPTYAKPYLLNGLYRSRLVGYKRQRLSIKVLRLLNIADMAALFDDGELAVGVAGDLLAYRGDKHNKLASAVIGLIVASSKSLSNSVILV